jgi:hypothetical protein
MCIKEWCNQSSSSFYWDCFINIQIPLADFATPFPNVISLCVVLNIHRKWFPIVLYRIKGIRKEIPRDPRMPSQIKNFTVTLSKVVLTTTTTKNYTKLRGLSPRANYTDRAAAAGRRS